MKSKKTILSSIAIWGIVASYAQERDTIAKSINVGDVYVTTAGTPHSLADSPVPISVINADQLRQANIFSLEDALVKLSPSISTMTNGMGTTVSYNGLNDSYFVFLLNGKRMDGDNAMARIDFSNVARIEMLSGASSVLYGTNAIGGVINIITNSGTGSQDGISGAVKSQISSHDRFRSTASVNIKEGKLLSSTSYNRNESGGWQLNEYEVASSGENEGELVKTDKIASTGFTSNTISQDFQFLLNNRLSFNASGSYYHNLTDRPYAAYNYNLHHESYTYSLGGVYMLNNRDKIELDYFSDNYRSSYSYLKDYSRDEALKGDLVMRKKTNFHNVNAKSLLHFGDNQTLYSGIEYTANSLSSVSDDLENKSAYTLAIYSQYEVELLENLSAVAGFRFLNHETFNSHATYHASARYGVGGFNFRASYSTGFRTPTLTELHAQKVTSSLDKLSLANINLRPETSNYFSLNAEYSNKWLGVSVTGFNNNLQNMIVYQTIASGQEAEQEYGYSEVVRRENIAKARVRGISTSVSLSPGYGFRFSGGYTFLDTKDFETSEPIDKSISDVYTIDANWEHRWSDYKLDIGVNGRISSERYSVTYGYAPKYQLWDLVTTHSLYFDKITLVPSIGIENILDFVDDRPYNSNYATLSPGRTIFASLAIRF